MKLFLPIAAVSVAGLVLFGIIIGFTVLSNYNQASSLKNQYDMKVVANRVSFDNMFKKVAQSVQVTDAQKNALKEIFNGYAAARTGAGTGGEVMKWITESVPVVDTKVYQNLQNIITASRDEWTRNQIEMVGIAQEYNQMLSTFPSKFVLGMFGFQKIDPQIVTSTRTDNAFATKKDDPTDLGFGK